MLGGIAAVVVVLAVAWVLFVPTADWLATHDVGSVTGPLRTLRLQTARDAARGRLLTLGAGLFAVAALVYTARNFTLSREGQVTERYTKAIEQLGSDKLDVRIGGMYALERVVRDSARDHPTVMEVLAAFIREHSREQLPPSAQDQSDADSSERTTCPDIQAAVTVIGRRNPSRDRRPVNLDSAVLPGAILNDADFSRAFLTRTHLADAYLARADLTGAFLSKADLARADLTFTNFTGALLADANLAGADLTHADLTRALLFNASFAGAGLLSADLTDADLTGTNFTDALLNDANLTRADLTQAKLTRVDLTGATLTGATFVRADLTGALLSPDAVVPDGWQRDADSGRLKRSDTSSGGATTTATPVS